ncbi:hypothetical protein Clacol_003447 [Clathrus columnatus]|uniref:Glutathione S-transferase n=1 Tax=Clathrus columnatus TaxID=1419009 RepID=A0AAV5A4L4_9AGAM|nr:hypothetical protein Clacol_003447 [Clathrus columnatus]
MSTPQVTLFCSGLAPNPLKVAILLEELGVSYKLIKKEFGDGENRVKAPSFLAINPNGRVPAIIDHTNSDKIVWESAAILLYVAEQFDNSGKYDGENLDEKAVIWEWLMFQISGLGPIQGQVAHFKYYHPVKNLDQSVYDRFINETYRVFSVLEKRLEKQEWIALDRFTIAEVDINTGDMLDMAFYPWLIGASYMDLSFDSFPHLKAYVDRISKIPSVETAYKQLQTAQT